MEKEVSWFGENKKKNDFKTYPHRRRLINQKVPLAEIKLQYLALFSYSEVTIYLIDL